MKNRHVEGIVCTLRTQHKITQRKLAKGLCSVTTLSRLETGERIPDKLLADTLLQRLGKLSNRLEIVMTLYDYERYSARKRIKECIIKKEYETARRLLGKYEEGRGADEPVHKQFILEMEAVLCELADGDIEKSREYIEKAIRVTMPEGDEEAMENAFLSITEIQLILMKIYHCDTENEKKKAWKVLEKIKNYVRLHYTDEEGRVKIYAKIACMEARIYLSEQRYEKAAKICGAALDMLGKKGILSDFYRLLTLMTEGLRHIEGEEGKLRKMEGWERTLKEIYHEYEIGIPEGLMEIFVENSQCEVLLIGEIMKRERNAKGMSQNELSKNICTPENISAIENGRRIPRLKKYMELAEKLGMDKYYYIGFLSEEQFEIHRLKQEYGMFVFRNEFEEAENLLRKIESMTDTKIPSNRQYVIYNKTLMKYIRKEIKEEDALKEAVHELELTFRFKNGNFRIDSIPTLEEVKILNFIGILYMRSGKMKKAAKLYRRILDSYEASKVSVEGHYIGSNLIGANLSMVLEEMDETEESMRLSREGIKRNLECGKGSMVPVYLINMARCLEKGEVNQKDCKKFLRQVHHISEMIRNSYKV